VQLIEFLITIDFAASPLLKVMLLSRKA